VAEERGAPAPVGLAAGAAALALGLAPLLLSPYGVIVLAHALILGIACTGVNLLLGYGGLLSLGHAAFFGLGAYAGGFLYIFAGNTSFEVYLLVGIGASTLLAALLGSLCVRTTRIAFTILTLAFAQMVHALFVAGIVFRLAGDFGKGLFFVAEGGLYLPRFTMAGVEVGPERFVTALYYVTAALFLLCLLLVWRVVGSPFGKALQATRDNETRARFIGISVRRCRFIAFVISGALVGLAGALAGELDRQVTAEQLHWLLSAQLVLAVILGGSRHFLGPTLGAFAVTLLQEGALRASLHHSLILGVLLIVVVFLFPGGVAAGMHTLLVRLKGLRAPAPPWAGG
jgi:branched-chain amino acid transport system permease protein